MRNVIYILTLSIMTACQTTPEYTPNSLTTVQTLNQAAKPFNSMLALPDFETDPAVMEQNMEMTLSLIHI